MRGVAQARRGNPVVQHIARQGNKYKKGEKMADDFDIFKFFDTFKETKERITREYIEGRITKEQFIERMKNAENSNN